ncbi:FAD-binding protein [Mycolicibacterium sp.]|uniref:FAD-binding protein n=1 Tax=Mycolicibacterium sp. TaxID=2320850 RepID=UPI00093B405E|nr:hypothetical protein EB73_35280 [Mycobacterium sp. SWH-M3]
MDWDDEVDVVCCGTGLGILAVALAAAEDGADVLVARAAVPADVPPSQDDATPALFAGVDDPQTRDYFDSLTADAAAADPVAAGTDLETRIVSEPRPLKAGGRIAPFYGSRLREWTGHCLASPYGVLYTRLTERGTTAMKTRSGEDIEVRVVGAVEPRDGASAASAVNDWLLEQLDGRVEVADDCSLQRIVFEEEQIAGVVIDTPQGSRAVRARIGLAFSTSAQPSAGSSAAEPGRALQFGLVGYNASRFGCVELLAPEPAASGGTSAYCRSNRVQDDVRETGRSHARRGRKVHRYPPFG